MSFEEQGAPALELAAKYAAEVDQEGRFPEEAIGALRDAGMLGLTLPTAVGGLDGTPGDFLAATRAIASRCASTAMIFLMHVCAAQVVLAGKGNDADELRALADGSNLSTLAFSERGSRSHFWAPFRPLAGWRLSAHNSFVTSAGHHNRYDLATRSADAEAPTDSTLYLVPASTGGIETKGSWIGLGLRGNASAPMTFDVEVSDGMLLGEAGKGFDLMLGVVLPWFQLGSGAVSVGIAEGAMGATVAHVTSAKLEHLDQTLADLPTVRGRIGRAQTEVDTVAGFLADVARRMGEGDPMVPILSAKASANEMAIRVTSEAMQACGGAAMSSSLPLERYFRDARAGSVMAPTTDVLYELTGRALAGMPLM